MSRELAYMAWKSSGNHAGAHRVVGRLIDQNERTRGAVARIAVNDQRLLRFDADASDVVHLQALEPADELGGIDVDAVFHPCEPYFNRLGRVFDQIFAPRVERLFAQPTNIRVEFVYNLYRIAVLNHHVAAGNVKVVLQ